ncbi:MAG TPA: hypothetical protein VMW75_29075 [Thermoanaerobaculia bacterium]|nr:hypothetical protein [Thermoanaerobaculia bacterium]
MRSHLPTGRLARWALPPAALAAIGCFAAHEVEPAAAAEGAYLGRLTVAVLVAAAALAPPPAAELGLGAALAVTAAWALPGGPGRGAAVIALLAATLAIAGARCLRHGPAAAASGAGEDRANLATAVALCFGLQVLLRGELLFAPGRALRPWVALLVLPVVAGAALALLWRHRGPLPALAAAGVAAVLAPGWTVATTLALVALAGGAALSKAGGVGAAEPVTSSFPTIQGAAGRERARTEVEADRSSVPPKPAVWRALRDALQQRDLRGWHARARVAAGTVALLLPIAWEPRTGWASALAGLALWRPGLAAAAALPLAAFTRGAWLAGWHLPGALAAHASWREGAAAVAFLVILVPAALPAARQPRSRSLLAAAALLAFATPWLPDRSALAAPLALAALALPATGAAAGLAAVWSAAVLLGTALLASYPWLRQDPLGDALALLGAHPGARLAAALGGGALLIGGGVEVALRRMTTSLATKRATKQATDPVTAANAEVPRPQAPALPVPAAWPAGRIAAAAASGALLAALIGPQLASPDVALLGGGSAVLLDRANPSWHTDLAPLRLRDLALQTSLINGAGLAAGTPVAIVRLLGTGTAPIELQLRAGEGTGEWAARRTDVAATSRLRSPRPWQAWVAGDFFGQRYRARLPLPTTGSFARLEVDLASGLPPETSVALYQVELEP